MLLVTLEEGASPKIERKILSETCYTIRELDLTAYSDEKAMLSVIEESVRSSVEQGTTHLRLYLVGNADPEILSSALDETNQASFGLALLDVQNLTIPVSDGNFLKNDITLRGALYRALLPKLTDDDPTVRRRAAKALQIGLCAIDGRAIPTEEGKR